MNLLVQDQNNDVSSSSVMVVENKTYLSKKLLVHNQE